MEACIPALTRYAWTLSRHAADADDLVHDCLTRALDRADTFDPARPVRPWLFAILHHCFISDLRRARARGESIPLESLAAEEPFSPPGQETGLQWRDLLRGLDALPLEQRAALLLVSVEDLSYAEAADVLGVPIGTIMSRIARGRERLRCMMDGGGAKMQPGLRRVK
jgi:RNA polymerase sigma-70 factor (ECF subfamily)